MCEKCNNYFINFGSSLSSHCPLIAIEYSITIKGVLNVPGTYSLEETEEIINQLNC